MARAGIVHRDPARGLQPGLQCALGLGDEALLVRRQHAHQLALGDLDPQFLQQQEQPLHRGLASVILRQHEAPQLRPVVTFDS